MSKRIVVLGGAESGTGAAVLAKLQGFDVFLSDMSNIAPAFINTLNDYRISSETSLIINLFKNLKQQISEFYLEKNMTSITC